MIIGQSDITYHAIHHQRWAQHYHNASWAALDCEYLEQAVYLQTMAMHHHERSWVFLLSLLLRDPII